MHNAMSFLEERCRDPGENDVEGRWGWGGECGAVNLEREGGWFLGKGRVSGSRPDGSGELGAEMNQCPKTSGARVARTEGCL